MSIVRIPSELMDWKNVDYSDKGNYEIALLVDGDINDESVQGHLTTDDIEKLITEYCYGPLPTLKEMSK